MAITTNGRYVVAGTGDGMVSLFHLKEKLIWKRKLEGAVTKVRVSARGRLLVAATDKGQLHMFNTTDFLIKRQSAHHGLDETNEIIFTKPQSALRKVATAELGVGDEGEFAMGRTTMVQQGPKNVTVAPRSTTSPDRAVAISKPSVVLYISLVMVLIGFFSFVKVGVPAAYLIDPVIGVLLMIFLMFIMIAAWISKN